MNLKDSVNQIFCQSNWHILFRQKQHQKLKKEVINNTSFLPSNCKLAERCYCIVHELSCRPICPICNTRSLNWNIDLHQYRKTCGNANCKQHNPETIEKRKQTNIDRYGVDNIMKTTQGQDKQQATMIKRYGVTHAVKNLQIKAKLQQTNRDRYGVHATCINEKIKQQQQQTRIQRYGVQYPLQSSKVRTKGYNTVVERYQVSSTSLIPEIRAKQINTLMQNYGVINPMCSEVIRHKNRINTNFKYMVIPYTQDLEQLDQQMDQIESQNDNVLVLTQFDLQIMHHDLQMTHKEISQVLNVAYSTVHKWCMECKVKTVPHAISYFEKSIYQFITQHYTGRIIQNDRNVIKPKELDIILPDMNQAFELNGVRWHGQHTANRGPRYHLNKTLQCQQQGYNLIHITSDQWINKQSIVKSRILAKLGVYNKLYARKTILKQISKNECVEFFDNNHLQGSCGYTIAYGLFLNDELVSAMSFGTPRFHATTQWELIRFANKLNISVVGGANKLFKHFLKQHQPTSIITYSDKSWNTGQVYEKMGFSFSHTSAPNFWVFNVEKGGKCFHRMKFQKHKLSKILDNFDPSLTAWQNLQRNGYDRYWDCGNDVWIWQP